MKMITRTFHFLQRRVVSDCIYDLVFTSLQEMESCVNISCTKHIRIEKAAWTYIIV